MKTFITATDEIELTDMKREELKSYYEIYSEFLTEDEISQMEDFCKLCDRGPLGFRSCGTGFHFNIGQRLRYADRGWCGHSSLNGILVVTLKDRIDGQMYLEIPAFSGNRILRNDLGKIKESLKNEKIICSKIPKPSVITKLEKCLEEEK